MFEGKMPNARGVSGPAEGAAEAGPLRQLSWSDLRARLEAARDLRDSLGGGTDENLASFDAFHARRTANQAEGKQAVNPDDLANGKADGCIDGASPDLAFGSDPRNT